MEFEMNLNEKKKKNEDNDNDCIDIMIMLWKHCWYGKNNNKFKNIFTELKNNQNNLNGYDENTINDYKNGINFFKNKNIK